MISACQKPSYQKEKVAEPEVESYASNEESKPNEYIIALSENVSIENAIRNLQKYDAQVIKDLKRGRYLIRLRNDPGIEQLKRDVFESKNIDHIQPNFVYTIQ